MKTLTSFRARIVQCLVSVSVWMICVGVGSAASTDQPDMTTFGQSKQAVVAETISGAQQFYREANFEKTLLYLGRAQRLAPDDPTIQTMNRECEARIAQKRALQKRVPQDPASLKRYIDGKYEDSRKLFNRRDYPAANEGFETVWLLAGNYRDTWNYLTRIRSMKTTPAPPAPASESSRPAAINVGQGADRPSQTPTVESSAPGADEMARKQAEEEKRQREMAIETALADGKQALKARQWDAAQAAFEKVRQLDPNNREANRSLAKIESERKADQERIAKEQEEEAREQARLKTEQEQRDRQGQIDAALTQGKELLEARQWDGARTSFEKALLLDPNNRPAKRALTQIDNERKADQERIAKAQEEKQREQARLQADQQERERAAREETERQKAAAISNDLRLARSHLKNERLDAADEAYKSVLAQDPNNAEAKAGLEEITKARDGAAARARQEQERKQVEERAAKLTSDLESAKSQFNADQYDKAIEIYQAVLKQEPENKTALKGIERANKAREEQRAEAQRLEAERKEVQRRQQIENNLSAAKTLERSNNFDQAISFYNEVFRDDPENRTALRGVDRCKTALQDQRREAEKAQAKPTPPTAVTVTPPPAPPPEQPAMSSPAAAVTTTPPAPTPPPSPTTETKPPVEVAVARPPEKATAPPAIADSRRQAKTKYDEAQKAIEAGQYDRALALLNEAVQIDSSFDPARQQARELRALLSQQTTPTRPPVEVAAESKKKAEPEGEAQAQKEAEAEAARKKAEADAEAEKKAKAAAEAEQKKQTEQTAARFVDEARDLIAKQDWDGAEKKSQEALQLNPNNSRAKALLEDARKGRQRAADREIKNRISQAETLLNSGRTPEAITLLEEIRKADPNNVDAQKLWRQAQGKLEVQKKSETAKVEGARREQINRLLAEGMAAYQRNDLKTAVEKWNEVLLIDPNNQTAANYLKETNTAYQEYLKKEEAKKKEAEVETAAAAKMEEKITVEVKPGTRLHEFLNTLSFVTGINFVVAHGADATIVAKFEDKRLREILDTVLPPNGLSWKRDRDIITVMPDISPRMFKLDSDLMQKVQRLYETNELQRILWGADTPPISGIELSLDDREFLLIMNDTKKNQTKMAEFLETLRVQTPVKMVTRMYAVRKDLAKDIKTLVEAMLRTEAVPEFEAERKVILAESEEGAQLIIRDTEDHIREVEKMLQDKDFLQHLERAELEVYTVNLTPRNVLTENKEMVAAWASDIVEVIDTMLYHDPGREESRKAGRRRWFDENTLQLTITDTPANIRKVAEFVEALPQLEPKMRSKILFLENALAGDLASRLEEVLGIAAAGGVTGAAQGNEASLSMRVEDERTFRDLSIRLVRVEENNFGDENDDSCQMVVRLRSGPSSDLSIVEYRSETFEEYEIYAEKVDPSSVPGEGRARIRVTYRPELAPGGPTEVLPPTQQQGPGAPAGGPAGPQLPEIEITPFEDLNALLIRYRNPAEFAELMDWIRQLDIPVLQISIETKFVEVNETIAKEYSADLQWLNAGQQGIVFDDSVMNMRFAQDIDEYRTGFEPPLEYMQNAGLLKGVTVLDLITGGESPLQFRLRFLEEEGLLNVISGPMVTVLNNMQATFQITPTTTMGGYGGYGGGYGGYGGGGYGGYGGGGYGGYGGMGRTLDFTVTPDATRKGQIRLSLSIQMTSNEFDMGQQVIQGVLGQALQPYALTNTPMQPTQVYRDLETEARVKDGGTIVLGGWISERTRDATSGIPVLRNIPYIGRLIFGRNSRISEKTNLLIFLTAKIID